MKVLVSGINPIKQSSFDVADVTVVTGPNGSGKTMLAMILYSAIETFQRFSVERLKSMNDELMKMVATTFSEILAKNYVDIYSIADDNAKITIEDNNAHVSFDISNKNINVEISDYSIIDHLRSLNPIFLPVNRVDVNSNDLISMIINSLLTISKIYKPRVIEATRLGLSLIIKDGELFAKFDNKEVPFSQLSYGFKQLVPIILVSESFNFIIIDEPTLNLHPDMQVKLANYLYDLVERGKKLFITTHSDIFTVQMSINHVKRGRDKGKTLKIYFLNDSKIEEIEYKENGDIEAIPTIVETLKQQSIEMYGDKTKH